MADTSERLEISATEQRAVRERCFHPSNTFVEFAKEEVEQSIPSRFEQVVRRYPDRLAVKSGNRSLTYRELNRAANRIGRAIRTILEDANEPVALLFENGIDIIAAILGSLKARKLYVPLDPTAPAERMITVLEDSAAKLIVTTHGKIELCRRLAGDERAFLDIDHIDESGSADDLGLFTAPDDLASVLYTSGSTGKPKGVVHSHRSQLHTVMINTNEARLCCEDRLTLLHSVGFGSGQAHLFQALLNGASLHCFDVKAEGIHELTKWLKREGITIYHSPPPVFRQLAEILPADEKLSSLRLIRLTGAPVGRRDFELYTEKFAPGALLQILLNSTEANVISSFIADGTFRFPEKGAPAGYPVAEKEVLVLDEQGLEVARGEVGEICVKSRYLPSGYRDKLKLTATQNRAPAGRGAGKIFLTGDLGRMLPDGFLVHLGRKDSMVKIRGYRVEVGEIENALLDYHAVKDATVLPWDREPGDKILVAYLVPGGSQPPSIHELHDFLKARLPEYMLPGCFMFLNSLPLINGKVDRSALPLPDQRRPELRAPYAQPRSQIEKILAEIWANVLSIDQVGIYDSFYDLGGHSLAAMRVVSRLKDRLSTKISLIELFENPTIAALAERIGRDPLSGAMAQTSSLPETASGQPLALSFEQERVWFVDQLEPETGQYNLINAYELLGQLNVAALEQSLNEIIARHASLRTVFPVLDGQPQQRIVPEFKLELPVVNLRGTENGEEFQAVVSRFCEEEVGRPFDLARGPLLRATLLRLADHRFVFVFAVHHLVFDGWSLDIFARELSILYQSLIRGEPSPFQSLPTQYADFVVWQRRRRSEAPFDNQLAYWKEELAGLPAFRVPSDRPRPRAHSGRGGQHWLTVSATVTRSLNELSREAGATLFMTLLAVYQTLLGRYAGENDVCVGIPISVRHSSALEETIGFFLNMLVIRTDLSGNPRFLDLLARVRHRCMGAYAHQDLPFGKLVEAVLPNRDISRNPLFQVTFTLRNASLHSLQLAGLEARRLDLNMNVARFDVELFLEEQGDVLHGFIAYNADMFDAVTIERMVDSLQVLLGGVAADPARRISDLPLLTDAERHQVLVEWNATQKEYPRDKSIHQFFEDQAGQSPESVAVISQGSNLRYRALNERANQLARYLRRQGVGAETRVAICLERSVEMIVALLAVLKAGGAYVPLDPEYPKERLSFILEDAQPAALLTERRLLEKFSAGKIPALCPEEHRPEIEREKKGNLVTGTAPENLAYVVYTSGSTGTPKGVMISHQALVNHMVWMQNAVPLGPADRVLQKTPFGFDASVWEFFAPLLAGAKLVLAGAQAHRDVAHLVNLIGQQKITILQAVPSLLDAMLADHGFADCQSLRRVFCGGEILPLHLAERFAARSNAQLYNLYGPSEATIDATFASCARDPDMQSIPIGDPIANTETYILDSYLEPVPIGAYGELHIGGDGLARGYLNRPEWTAEKFIPHPFSGKPGSRLYRTGDLCRYLPAGKIDFAGRIDGQVKLRGYRIEPGEIEATLGGHSTVRRAVVMAREDTPGDKRLAAYVVPSEQDAANVEDLRNFLKRKLPEQMIPSAFVFLRSLPVTPNGKIDLGALPAPDQTRPELNQTFVAPRTDLEKRIGRIWSEVLKVDPIGIHDSFFALGGHSLLATQVVSRISIAVGAEVPLRAMFDTPTIAELAAFISANFAAGVTVEVSI